MATRGQRRTGYKGRKEGRHTHCESRSFTSATLYWPWNGCLQTNTWPMTPGGNLTPADSDCAPTRGGRRPWRGACCWTTLGSCGWSSRQWRKLRRNQPAAARYLSRDQQKSFTATRRGRRRLDERLYLPAKLRTAASEGRRQTGSGSTRLRPPSRSRPGRRRGGSPSRVWAGSQRSAGLRWSGWGPSGAPGPGSGRRPRPPVVDIDWWGRTWRLRLTLIWLFCVYTGLTSIIASLRCLCWRKRMLVAPATKPRTVTSDSRWCCCSAM